MSTKAKAAAGLRPFEEYVAAGTDMQPHLERIRAAVIAVDAQHVVELGVRYGYSSAAILHGVHETGGRLTSVELNTPQPYVDAAWDFIGGDDTAPGVLARIPESIDVLLIDTTHTLTHTAQELALYAPRVRPGGLIIAHDTCETGVWFPLRDLFTRRGVHWQEWPESYGLAILTLGPDPDGD